MRVLATLERYESAFWTLVLVGVLWFRWPLLKGYYYRAAQVEALPPAVAWRHDLGEALAESRATGRPVLVNFTATWCPWCRYMKHDVWTDPAVGRTLVSAFVPLELDVDHDGGVSARYGVDAVPTLLVIDQEGRERRRTGFLRAGPLVEFLRAP